MGKFICLLFLVGGIMGKFICLLFFVAWLWQELEILMIGTVNPNNVDTIVCVVLTLSIYLNLKHWEDRI